MEVKSGRMFEKEILPFMEERIMKNSVHTTYIA